MQKEEEIKNQIQEKEKVEEGNRDEDGINNLKQELTNLQKEIENKKSNIIEIKDKEIAKINMNIIKKVKKIKLEENGNDEEIEKQLNNKEGDLIII